jgi:hypothetical protein
MKTPLQNEPPKSSTFGVSFVLKSVFVQLDDGTFLQNWLIHSVQLIMDALAVPPRKSVWRPFTKWQNSWMTNTWLTLVFKRRPHKIYGNCTVRWTFGGEGHREFGNVKTKVHAGFCSPKNGQLHNEPVVPFRKFGLPVVPFDALLLL